MLLEGKRDAARIRFRSGSISDLKVERNLIRARDRVDATRPGRHLSRLAISLPISVPGPATADIRLDGLTRPPSGESYFDRFGLRPAAPALRSRCGLNSLLVRDQFRFCFEASKRFGHADVIALELGEGFRSKLGESSPRRLRLSSCGDDSARVEVRNGSRLRASDVGARKKRRPYPMLMRCRKSERQRCYVTYCYC
jgi:hypothetical protein